MSEYLRRTGRTTRMLKEVISEGAKGYAIVYCGDSLHRKEIIKQASKLCEVRQVIPEQKIYLKSGGQITFELISDGRLDLSSGIVTGAYPSIEIFADHYAIERAIPWAIREFHRFDDTEKFKNEWKVKP